MTTPALTPGEQHIRDLCIEARKAAQMLATLPTEKLDHILDEIAV
jgi:hypothetical protein